MDTLLIITHCPDEKTANAIALALVEGRLAACVNILPRMQSIYRWQGAVESATEVPLFIKTIAGNYAAIETLIRDRHPYDVPEIIALPVAAGLPAYLNWVAKESLQ
ncbi:hypothetical protein B566_EDAN003192 [Ephemera danica]|nr:hypothetical protein B566_EDAN003192 [Ephemera danica]